MPDLKLSGLAVDAAPSTSDYLETLDVSDTSMGPGGSNKRVLVSALLALAPGGGGAVSSVAGRTGAVVLAESDIANLTSDLAARAPLASPAFTGTFSVAAGAATFDASGYGLIQPFGWSLGLGTPATTVTVANPSPVAFACKLAKVQVAAGTAPTGSSLIVDIQRSADQGGTWASLWATTPANRPTLAAGSKYASGTAFDTTTLAAGDLLRAVVTQVGSTVAGQDVTLKLTSLARNS